MKIAERIRRSDLAYGSRVGLAKDIGDVLSFVVADTTASSFLVSQHIREVVKKAIDTPCDAYTPHSGTLDARKIVAEKVKRENKIMVNEANVAVTPGTQMGIFATLLSLIDPKDEVLIMDPEYACLEPCARFAGAEVTRVPLEERNGEFRFAIEELRKRASPKTRLLMFSNPSNPTGLLYTKDELKAIAEIAEENDFMVFSDELYNKLIYDNHKYCSIASLSDMKDRSITTMGVTKTESMQAFRIGYVIANEEIIESISKILRYAVQRASYISQIALVAAITEPPEFGEERIRQHKEARDFIVEKLNEINGIKCNLPKGTSYVFPSIRVTGLSSQEFCDFLLRKVQVYVPPGIGFGPNGEGHFRLCFAQGIRKLRDGASRIAKAVQLLIGA